MFDAWKKLKEVLSAKCTFTGYCQECGTPIGVPHSKPVAEQVAKHDAEVRNIIE